MEMTIEQALQRAIDAHKAGKLQDAESIYRAILQNQPKHPIANHNIGVLALSVNKPDAALPFLKNAVEENPNQMQFWISYVDGLIKARQFDNAGIVLKQGKALGLDGQRVKDLEGQLGLLEINVKNKGLEASRLSFAIEHREAGRYREAQEWLKVYLYNYAKDAEAYSLLAHIYLLDKNIQDSITTLQKAISINPELISVIRNEVRVLLAKSKPLEALEKASYLISKSPNEPENLFVFATSLGANNRLDEAFQAIEKSLHLNDGYAEAYAFKATLCSRTGNLSDAIRNAEKALSIKSHLTQVWAMLGSLNYRIKNIIGAIEAMRRAHELDPCNINYMIDLGEFLRQHGNTAEAINILEQATKSSAENVSAWINLGTAYQQASQIKNAKICYEKVLLINSKSPEILSNLGIIAKEEGNLDLAIEYFDKALDLNPVDQNILGNKAQALIAGENYSEAIRVAEYSLEISKNHIPTVLAITSALIGLKKNKESLEIIFDVIICFTNGESYFTDDEKTAIYRQIARVLDSLKRHKEAMGYLEKAISINSGDTENFKSLGIHLSEIEKFDEAEIWIRKALVSRPDEISTLIQLAGLLDTSKRFDEGWIYLDKAKKINPKNPWILQAIGTHLSIQKRWEEAKRYFLEAISINKNLAQAHCNLGSVLKEIGNKEDAISCYEMAITINPHFGEAHSNLGATLQELGLLEAAESSFRKAVEIQPDFEQAQCNLAFHLMNMGRFSEAKSCLQIALEQVGQGKWFAASTALINLWILGAIPEARNLSSQFKEVVALKDSNDTNKVYKAFFLYLTKLLESLDVNQYMYKGTGSDDNLLVFGESHSLGLNNLKFNWLEGSHVSASSRFISGIKMYHLKSGANKSFRMNLSRHIRSANTKSHLLFTIGEIDCRPDEGLWAVYLTKKNDLVELISETVEGYLSWLQIELTQRKFLSITIQGVPAPNYNFDGRECNAQEFLKMLHEVNVKLQQGANKRGWKFLDVYGATANSSMKSSGVWHIDGYHLKPAFYGTALDWVK
jgi:protein O-GlcNAc transferase